MAPRDAKPITNVNLVKLLGPCLLIASKNTPTISQPLDANRILKG